MMEEITLNSISRALEQLSEKIDALALSQKDEYCSNETKDLDAALAKAQGEYPQIGYNKENPYFKSGYATLDHIMGRVRPILAKNGLSLVQQRRYHEDGEMMLHTILKHATGQWIESRSRVIPPKNDMQTLGSTLSYLKRYDAMALLGITVSEDPSDDDGEVAVADTRNKMIKGVSNAYDPREKSSETITKEQLDELEYELAEIGNPKDIINMIYDTFQIQALVDVPKNKYRAIITRIREIKEVQAGRKKA